MTPTSTVTWGDVLRYVVAIDAFVVLSGSVLTSYVGMGGLLKYVAATSSLASEPRIPTLPSHALLGLSAYRRLAMDRCFPAMVLARNKWRGTHHVIIFGFFLVSPLSGTHFHAASMHFGSLMTLQEAM